MGAARDSGSAGTEDTRRARVCRGGGASGARDPHRRLCGYSPPPRHFKPQEAASLCSVPLQSSSPTLGQPRPGRGALWECGRNRHRGRLCKAFALG